MWYTSSMGYTGDKKREYQRQWIARRRSEWFLEKFCKGCGAVDELELDHIDPDQKIDHRIWSWSWPRIQIEVSKCQVLCKECHLEKSIAYATSRRSHGLSWYGHGCRCDICKEAQRKHNARRYASIV